MLSPPTLLWLARYFGNSIEFWLGLQQHDLSVARLEMRSCIEREVQVLART